jgi:phosphatidylglycerol:prolipoprotein diacylglycerol transferase
VHWKKLGFMRMSDLTAPGLAAAYAVGRTGCWAVGDDYGRPWNSPLAVAFPDGAPPSTAQNLREFGINIPADVPANTVFAVHPTQLYEVTLACLMFALLWRLRDHKHAQGWLFGLYCFLAGAERFIIEFFRAKDDRFLGTFTVAQLIALAFVLVGAAWMAARWTTGPGRPGIYAHQQPKAAA